MPYSEPDRAGDATAGFDPIDVRRLTFVEQLDGCRPGIQQEHTAVLTLQSASCSRPRESR